MHFDINRQWYRPAYTVWTLLLLPLSWLFCLAVSLRRLLYRRGLIKSKRFAVPVVIVGNITVGGTGKTPFVLWLAHFLKSRGWNPGIVSRGYGGLGNGVVQAVTAQSDPVIVGDEAVLLARHSHCPMIVGVDRVASVEKLLGEYACDIVISDDGLQHYRLARDMEIIIVDGMRRLGNQALLPAGPLREPASRLNEVDFVVTQGYALHNEIEMILQGDTLVSLKDHQHKKAVEDFAAERVHVVAAIGHPQRFFDRLRRKNIDVIEHPFPDHYLFSVRDFNFGDDYPIIMTEKDEVKCEAIADHRFWYLPVEAQLSAEFDFLLERRLLAILAEKAKK